VASDESPASSGEVKFHQTQKRDGSFAVPFLCAVHEWQLGGASPLHILMEEKC